MVKFSSYSVLISIPAMSLSSFQGMTTVKVKLDMHIKAGDDQF